MKPILFSTPMIKAILAGTKTQTRRVIKPQPPEASEVFAWNAPERFIGLSNIDALCAERGCYYRNESGLIFHKKCPYGEICDQLWVRETAYISGKNFTDRQSMTYDHEQNPTTCRKDSDGDFRYVSYCADLKGGNCESAEDYGIKKSPSIFMPKWASRITLEITNIRVERLRDISLEDAEREGVRVFDSTRRNGDLSEFIHLWDSINKERGFGWSVNPFLWVIEFKKL